jgi:serine/threonine protein kinase
MKVINRFKIEKYDLLESLKLERDILLNLDHPFILKLLTAFNDNYRIYLITEYIRGIDLFDALRKLEIPSDRDT